NLRGSYSPPSPLHRRCLQHSQPPLRTRLSEPGAIRGSPRPATCQNRRLKLSPIKGGLNGSTQHSILQGKDGVFGDASRLFSRLYGIRENRALGSLAAGRVAESDWASVW